MKYYRFKTASELEVEYGEDWQDIITPVVTPSMMYLLGQSLTDLDCIMRDGLAEGVRFQLTCTYENNPNPIPSDIEALLPPSYRNWWVSTDITTEIDKEESYV